VRKIRKKMNKALEIKGKKEPNLRCGLGVVGHMHRQRTKLREEQNLVNLKRSKGWERHTEAQLSPCPFFLHSL
jgi:hypothetical protein